MPIPNCLLCALLVAAPAWAQAPDDDGEELLSTTSST